MTSKRALVVREFEKERARQQAAKDPARLEFIQRLTSPLFDGDALPFRFRHHSTKHVMCRAAHILTNERDRLRYDVVTLEIPCDCATSGVSYHEVRLVCFPEIVSSNMPARPDRSMLSAPYPTSVEFWSRVQECHVDDYAVFNSTASDSNRFLDRHIWRMHSRLCVSHIFRALDLIFTFVLDHVVTLQDPDSGEHVLPSVFQSLSIGCPLALVAHCHRWGASISHPLDLFPDAPNAIEFWHSYDAARARVSLPPTVDAARHILVRECNQFDFHSTTPPYAPFPDNFGQRFPNAKHVTAGVAELPFVVFMVAAFSNVKAIKSTIRTADSYGTSQPVESLVLDLARHLFANGRLESCWLGFAPRWHSRSSLFHYRDSRGAPREFTDIFAFLPLRRGLLELTTADYHVQSPKLLPPTESRPVAWTGFFGSPIYERQTIGIVAAFLYGAKFTDAVLSRLSSHMRAHAAASST